MCSTVCQLDEVHHQKCAPGEPRTGTKHNRGSLGFCTARWRHSSVKQCRAAASRKARFGAYIALTSGMHNPHLLTRLIWEDDLLRYHRRLRLKAQISCVFHIVSLHVFSWASPTARPTLLSAVCGGQGHVAEQTLLLLPERKAQSSALQESTTL